MAYDSEPTYGQVRRRERRSDESETCEARCNWGQEVGLADIQLRAIELTVRGLSDSHIAAELGLERRTLWRWKTLDEEYRKVLAETRMQVHAAAGDRYQLLLLKATSVLAKLLDDPSPETRFRAAHVLLTMAGCYRPMAPALPGGTSEDDQDYGPLPLMDPKVG